MSYYALQGEEKRSKRSRARPNINIGKYWSSFKHNETELKNQEKFATAEGLSLLRILDTTEKVLSEKFTQKMAKYFQSYTELTF